jgi:hypothetical protein
VIAKEACRPIKNNGQAFLRIEFLVIFSIKEIVFLTGCWISRFGVSKGSSYSCGAFLKKLRFLKVRGLILKRKKCGKY